MNSFEMSLPDDVKRLVKALREENHAVEGGYSAAEPEAIIMGTVIMTFWRSCLMI